MDDWPSSRPGCGTRRKIGRPANDSVGLCRGAGLLELSDDGDPGSGDLPSSAEDEAGRCRSLLDALLRHNWPGRAGDWAAALIAEFGSLPAVLAAGTGDRARIIDRRASEYLGLVQSAILRSLRARVTGRKIISTSRQLIDYLQADMSHLRVERFRVLFLTSQNELLADELVWEGTVGEAPAYPREIVKRALEVGATGLLLVHNHPSGNHQPSQGDVDATRRIATAAATMGMCLHDHLIVSHSGWSSFRKMGLLETVAAG